MAATRKLAQSGLELQASATGEQATQRAQESRTRNVQQTRTRAEGARQFDEQMDQRDLDRWQRQWEEKRANDLRQQQLAEQGRQFDVSAGQRGQQIDMEAADKGLERQGGGGGGAAGPRIGGQPAMGTPGPRDASGDPRMQAMQAEMARGRQQMSQGLEQGTQGRGYVKSASRLKSEAAAEERAQTDVESRRISAVASYKRATDAYRIAEIKAQSAGSASARAQETAALKELKTQLMQPIKSTVATMNRMMDNKGSLQDWQSVQAELKNSPNVGGLAQLKADADGKQWTDRLQTFFQQKAVVQGLKYINATGELPDGDMIDMSSPGMQEFTKAAADVAMMNDPSVPGPGQLMSFRDQAARLRYINRTAAWQVLNRKVMQEAAQTGGDPLNPALPGRAPDSGFNQRAGPGGRVPPATPGTGNPPGQINQRRAAEKAAQPAPVLPDVEVPKVVRPGPGEPGYVHPLSSRDSAPDWNKVK